MKKILLFILISYLYITTYGQLKNSSCYQKYSVQGKNRFYNSEYGQAKNNFIAAKICQNISTDEYNSIIEWIQKTDTCIYFTKEGDSAYENEDFRNASFCYIKVLKINPKDKHCERRKEICLIKYQPYQEMILIEKDIFNMGTEEGRANEAPVHEIQLDSFYIDKYEVTNYEYVKFLNNKNQVDVHKWIHINDNDCKIEYKNNKFQVKLGFENYPVVEVTWFGANAYAKWCGKRLPTEAEWEIAAKGGVLSNRYKFSGSNNYNEVAINKANSSNKCFPVGSKKPNELGLYDMSGNVWEWVSDWYWPSYYLMSPFENPEVINDCEYKVTRGGAFTSQQDIIRPEYRNFEAPDDANKNIGFRCVMDIK